LVRTWAIKRQQTPWHKPESRPRKQAAPERSSLPNTGAIFNRFAGINGSAYLVGGFGMTALTGNNIVVVPIRSGIGLRLGANLGYLKFTEGPTWNPF
jgi:hypothetical protein